MSGAAPSIAVLGGGRRLANTFFGTPREPVPVLLLRPLGGTMALWGAFGERLAAEFRVLMFDYRGMGASSAAPVRVTVRSLAQDALDLLDNLEIERACVFGISLGAMAATWLAALAPHRVARLCLASLPVRGRALLGRDLGAVMRMSACFAKRPAQVEPCLVEHLLARFGEQHPDELQRIVTLVSRSPTSPLTLLKNTLAAVQYDGTPMLPGLTAPTLVLGGEQDALLGPDAVRRVADRIPGAQLQLIPGAGHDLTLEHPLGTAERVAAFFRRR